MSKKVQAEIEEIERLESEIAHKLFDGDIPEWLTIKDKNTIQIRTERDAMMGKRIGDEFGVPITPADVVQYYATEARNITSGCRTLAGFTSDWRGVDGMAKTSLEVFKVLNREALEREGEKHGMTLRS